jgi:glycosyltransferase involved in cell wall biosynthesis
MTGRPRVSLIIPALDEEEAIGLVLRELPRLELLEVIVVDNGSRDGTAAIAEREGARVVREPRRGYGSACLAGIAAADRPDVVAFLDADHSHHSEELPLVVEPILSGRADLVVGSRVLGGARRDSLLLRASIGNRLACRLLRSLYGATYTDLGPFRAIRADALSALAMGERTYGWTVEMQAKAALRGLRSVEVPVRCRPRIGRSKITGTVRGSVGAGWKILATLFRLKMSPRQRSTPSPGVTGLPSGFR